MCTGVRSIRFVMRMSRCCGVISISLGERSGCILSANASESRYKERGRWPPGRQDDHTIARRRHPPDRRRDVERDAPMCSRRQYPRTFGQGHAKHRSRHQNGPRDWSQASVQASVRWRSLWRPGRTVWPAFCGSSGSGLAPHREGAGNTDPVEGSFQAHRQKISPSEITQFS
jgi:hypothetical protein